MKKVKGRAILTVIGVLGAAVSTLPLTVYRFVETAGMHRMSMGMACEKACLTETVVGGVVTAAAVFSFFAKNGKINAVSSAILLAGGIAAIVTPSFIGLYKGKEMACRYITAPTLTVLGSAIIILVLIRIISSLIESRKTAAPI